MKCIEVQFPPECTQEISWYRNKEGFKKILENYCDEMLGDPCVFTYNCIQNEELKTHTWKCTQCDAFLLYGQEDKKMYALRDLLSTHTHSLKAFENCNPDLFDSKIKPKDILIRQPIFELYKVIVGQQSDAIKNMLKTQWQKQYPQRPVPRLESSFIHNHIYIVCRQYRERERPKCPFKIVYQQMKQSPYLYELQKDQTQMCHKHLLTYYKESKVEDIEANKDTKKKQNHQDRFKQYLFDCEVGGSIQSIFINLRNLIQQAKQLGFQILIPTPDTAKQKNQQTVLTDMHQHVDEDDYFLITNKICKFLYRSYGNTLFITRLFINQIQSAQISYAVFIFQGFNFKHQNVYYSLAICQNPSRKKLKDMINFFFQYFEQKQNFIMVANNQTDLYEVLCQLKTELKNFNIHKYFNKKNLNTNIIQAQFEQLNKYYQYKDRRIPNPLTNPRYEYLKVGFSKNHFYGLTDYPAPQLRRISRSQYNWKNQKQEKPSITASNDNIFRAGIILKTTLQFISQRNKNWKLIQRERDICFQKYYDYQPIRRWRMIMGKKPFTALVKQFEKMRCCFIQLSNPPNFYIVEHEGYPFVVSNNLETLTWNCDCGLRNRTGIPCCHLIRVMIEEKQPVLKSVNKFWVIDEGLMKVLTPFTAIKRRARARSKLTFLNHLNN